MRLLPLLCLCAAAGAVEEVFTLFSPRPTPPDMAWRLAGELRAQGRAADRDGSGRLAFDHQRLGGSWLALRGEADEGWLQIRAARTGIDGDAVLPGGSSPDGEYVEGGFGGTWKRLLGGGSVVGATASAACEGQVSESEGLEWSGTGTVFSRIGLGETGEDGLLLALNYDADRVIFSDVPVLPLVAWQGMRGPWMLVLGVPFSVIGYRAEAWRVNAVLGPLPSLAAEHRIDGPWSIFGEAKWNRQQWRRADRQRNDDRLELSQWEWSGGLRLGFGPMIQFDALAGVATARRLGEAEDSTEARRDGLQLEAAPFAALRGRIVF